MCFLFFPVAQNCDMFYTLLCDLKHTSTMLCVFNLYRRVHWKCNDQHFALYPRQCEEGLLHTHKATVFRKHNWMVLAGWSRLTEGYRGVKWHSSRSRSTTSLHANNGLRMQLGLSRDLEQKQTGVGVIPPATPTANT